MDLATYLKLSAESDQLWLELTDVPLQAVSEQDVKQLIAKSKYKKWLIDADALDTAVEEINNARSVGAIYNPIQHAIGMAKDADVAIIISQDKMEVEATITAAEGGKDVTEKDILAKLREKGVKKGMQSRALRSLLKDAAKARPGTKVVGIIAKGADPKNGKDSKFKALVPSLAERILRPAGGDSIHKVDMRDLGPLLSVKIDQDLFERIPPTKGRAGFNVMGKEVAAVDGKLIKFSPGEGTAVSPKDQNMLVATRVGMPRFTEDGAVVDDTLNVKEVSIHTGHIEYDGAVICSGDVREKMRIKAEGDVTIAGTVQSAVIEAKGDVVIMKGALGKKSDRDEDQNSEFSCFIIASGNVFVEHVQGVQITAGGNVVVKKQLAFSKVRSNKNIIIGDEENPNGKVFASTLYVTEQVKAGVLGATSGSTLTIVYSDIFEKLEKKQRKLEADITVRAEKLMHIQNALKEFQQMIREGKSVDLDELRETYKSYKQLRALLKHLNTQYQKNTTILPEEKVEQLAIATRQLFTNVVIHGHHRIWRNETEWGPSKISLDEAMHWNREPL